MTRTAVIKKLVDVMRRADPAWCELHGKRQTDREERSGSPYAIP